MPTFVYKARTRDGESRSGNIEASSEEMAVSILQKRDLLVLSVRETEKQSWLEWRFGSGVRQKDLVVFSRQLSTLFEAQIPALDALRILLNETERPAVKRALARVLDDVAGGMALSQAMAQHPKIFSAFYVNLVRSGEESGKLQEVFTYLADYLERSYYLTTKARNAMIYPAFVFVAFLGVIIVMLVAVIPRLTSIFEETGQAVPFYTQAVISLSYFLRQWGFLFALLLVGGAVGLWRWGMTERGRYALHQLQVTIPIIGGLYRKLYVARVADNLKTLISAGIPVVRALEISGDVVGNEVYRRAVREAMESVKAGSTISAAFIRVPEIPVLVTQMIKIGEASGRLDFILGSLARFYTREVDSMVENLVSLIEPALIIFLGVGVGILVVSVLVPLYNLVGAV